MDPFTGLLGALGLAGAAAGVSAGGSAVDAAIQYHYAKKMYQHRYRWAIDDMKKAGLNPILATNGGSVAGMSSAPSTDFAGAGNSGISAAINAAKTVSDIQAQDVNNEKTKQDQRLAEANTENIASRTTWQNVQNNILSRQEKSLVEDAQARATNNRALATLNSARAENARALADAEASTALSGADSANSRAKIDSYKSLQELSNPETHLGYDERLKLYRQLKNAEILQKQMAPFWQGVNSAARVFK